MRVPLERWLAEVALVPPGSPDDACELVGEGDGGLVVAAPFLQVERPESEPIDCGSSALRGSCGYQHGSGAMDEQGSKIWIALLADAPEASAFARRELPRG